ncbi:L,D-transpeptidase [Nocardioides sp. Y6]|uniref:L,D-transpeptidase n=1 Tax=Nocardioides malaquae TaxID=2773426 RepID=A0ABR9RVK7_9ACTN|nr:L,D-transpeptidase [Nocardioides malaquae]MBE7325561.1 L,D-transpeptidase [Nocardioides malaquae]
MDTRRALRALTSVTLTVAVALLLVAGGGRLHTDLLWSSPDHRAPTPAAVPAARPSPSAPSTPAAEPRLRPTQPRPTQRPAATPTQQPTQRPSHPSSAGLDARCRTGRVICVDKTTQTLRWVVDGDVTTTMEARFGGSSTPTREGEFRVFAKSRDHVSSLYGTSMPFAMFFSGGQAVHYSPDFAAVGYAGASHGCVNLRDAAGAARLFDQVVVGDRVVVWRS